MMRSSSISQAHFVCGYDCESSRERLPAWSRTPDNSEHIRVVYLDTLLR